METNIRPTVVPDPHTKIIPCWSDRLGGMCKLHLVESRDAVGRIRESNINVRGPLLFNLQLTNVKNIIGRPLDFWKRKKKTNSTKVYQTSQVAQEERNEDPQRQPD